MTKLILALAAAITAPACSGEPARFEPLTQKDQEDFVGYTCSAGPAGTVLFMADTETGAIRYAGRLVRLAPSSASHPFDPAEARTQTMMEVPGGRVSLRIEPRPGRAVADDATESLTRPVRLVLEDRFGSGIRSASVDTELVCAS